MLKLFYTRNKSSSEYSWLSSTCLIRLTTDIFILHNLMKEIICHILSALESLKLCIPGDAGIISDTHKEAILMIGETNAEEIAEITEKLDV